MAMNRLQLWSTLTFGLGPGVAPADPVCDLAGVVMYSDWGTSRLRLEVPSATSGDKYMNSFTNMLQE